MTRERERDAGSTATDRAGSAPNSKPDASGPSNGTGPSAGYNSTDGAGPANPNIDDLLSKLDRLERTVDAPHEREKVRQTITLVERMPGSKAFTKRIHKYTTRDVAESFVGGIILSLPLLVEDGVFDIAAWFTTTTVASVPVFLVANVVFVIGMTTGLIYFADFRDVRVRSLIFGFIPGRLIAVLTIAFIVAFSMLFMWGRLHEGDPSTLEALGRVTVIWAAASFGAALGDIIPGESTGRDVAERVEAFGDSFRDE